MSQQQPTGARTVGVVCPYCGHAQAASGGGENQCGACRGLFDPLSRQATQNAMGPWWVLNPSRPTGPGISYEKLCELAQRGKIKPTSIVRGPTTRQFWALARDVAGVAVLLGECHNCHREVMPDEFMCGHCNAVLAPRSDRQHLGLAPVQLLPGEASPQEIAASTRPVTGAAPAPAQPAQARRASTAPPRAATADDGELSAGTARRMRQQMARLQMYLVILLVFVGVLVAAVALLILDPFEGLTLGRPAEQRPASTQAEQPPDSDDATSEQATPNGADADPDPAPGASEPTPADDPEIDLPEMPPPLPDEALLDEGLEPWRKRFERAVELERLDTIQSVTEAIAILEAILAEAAGSGMPGEADYPLLEGRLEGLRDRLETLELREQFEGEGD